jgi:hypothetical protein
MIIFRGLSSLSYDFYVLDNDGEPINISTDTINLYVKNSLLDDDANALLNVVCTIVDGPNGHANATVTQGNITNLEDRYYPYIIKRTSGTDISCVEYGNFNVNQPYNEWEWEVDIYEGVTLSSIVSQANTLLRYRDWDTTKLIEWCNDAIKNFNKSTGYYVSRATILSKNGKNTYLLPKDILQIHDIYLDTVRQYRNRQWIRETNKIIFMQGINQGNQTIELVCSKLPQNVTEDNQYIEIIPEATEAIVYYVCWKAKLEDREFSEADVYWNLYSNYVEKYTDKNIIDSTEETQFRYIGQGNTFLASEYSNTPFSQ